MQVPLFENETFSKIDYRNNPLEKGEYEGCTFSQCDFSGSDISRILFTDCEFIECDLSMIKMIESSMQNVRFLKTRLLGVEFKSCNEFLFDVSFGDCNLELASFSGMKLKKIYFKNSDCREVNFIGSNLNNARFENCNLEKALFQNTNLEKTDLCTSYGYIIDPEQNQIKGAKFSLEGLPGLLIKYNIIIH